MAVLVPRKLIFLEHPRTGSTSIRAALSRLPGAKRKSRHTLFLPERGEKTFSVVRNPYDSLVSWWHAVKDKWDFENFESFIRDCENPFLVQQGNLFYFAKHSDFIIKFETLQRDLNIVLRSVGLRGITLPRLNTTKDKRAYASYYSPEAVEIVKARFGSELEAFGYGLGRL